MAPTATVKRGFPRSPGTSHRTLVFHRETRAPGQQSVRSCSESEAHAHSRSLPGVYPQYQSGRGCPVAFFPVVALSGCGKIPISSRGKAPHMRSDDHGRYSSSTFLFRAYLSRPAPVRSPPRRLHRRPVPERRRRAFQLLLRRLSPLGYQFRAACAAGTPPPFSPNRAWPATGRPNPRPVSQAGRGPDRRRPNLEPGPGAASAHASGRGLPLPAAAGPAASGSACRPSRLSRLGDGACDRCLAEFAPLEVAGQGKTQSRQRLQLRRGLGPVRRLERPAQEILPGILFLSHQ